MATTNPVVTDPDPTSVEWANHFWDECKYRDEKWFRTFYRSIWIIGILWAVPWIPWISEKFPHEIEDVRIRVVYGLMPIAFFALTVCFLATQFGHLKVAERQLTVFRGRYGVDKPTWRDAFRGGTARKTYAFIIVMGIAWLVWFVLLLCTQWPRK